MTTEVTAFRRCVFDALCNVPRGKVTTYKILGESIGCHSSRAIGQALRNNPFAPQVPCHRVIRTDLSIGGFSGETEGPQIRKKLKLLREEGVVFEDGRLADPRRVHTFK